MISDETSDACYVVIIDAATLAITGFAGYIEKMDAINNKDKIASE
jgi:hypothetical protein